MAVISSNVHTFEVVSILLDVAGDAAEVVVLQIEVEIDETPVF